MTPAFDAVRRVIERELDSAARLEPHAAAALAAEAVYGLTVDDPDLPPDDVAEALAYLVSLERLAPAARAAASALGGSGASDAALRDRVRSRRAGPHASAVELARAGDVDGLRRVGGRALRLALQAAGAAEAAVIARAWALLPVRERERT